MRHLQLTSRNFVLVTSETLYCYRRYIVIDFRINDKDFLVREKSYTPNRLHFNKVAIDSRIFDFHILGELFFLSL